MYWVPFSGISGIQGNLGIRLADNIHRRHALALVVGTIHWEVVDPLFGEKDILDLTYLGAVYNLNVGGFFLEVGGAGVIKSVSSPEPDSEWITPALPLLQIGYMYRFIPPE